MGSKKIFHVPVADYEPYVLVYFQRSKNPPNSKKVGVFGPMTQNLEHFHYVELTKGAYFTH